MMECKNYREQLTSLLSGAISEELKLKIESHLEVCTECCEEYEALQKVWFLMGELEQPEPSASMHEGFNAALSDYKREQLKRGNQSGNWVEKLREFLSVQLQPKLAYSVLLVVIGLLGGYFLRQPQQQPMAYNQQIDSLSSQISEMKQVLMFSLLQDPSASQRMRAVAYTEEITNVDLKVIDALLTTLNEDPNVNVRLATLEALTRLADDPRVREGLVHSIEHQDSPIMQSAIADLMVKLQEKRSVKSLQRLLNKKDINERVKVNIEKSIQKLT